jgi:hypothetical protein
MGQIILCLKMLKNSKIKIKIQRTIVCEGK